jgi:hypothetical protein
MRGEMRIRRGSQYYNEKAKHPSEADAIVQSSQTREKAGSKSNSIMSAARARAEESARESPRSCARSMRSRVAVEEEGTQQTGRRTA